MKPTDKYQIVLERKHDKQKFVANPEFWDKLKKLPEAQDLLKLIYDFNDLKDFLEPFLIQRVKERIVDRLRYGSCHYSDFYHSYGRYFSESSLNILVRELIKEGEIERTDNGWYRIPKIMKPM